jgi:hypothetical protein
MQDGHEIVPDEVIVPPLIGPAVAMLVTVPELGVLNPSITLLLLTEVAVSTALVGGAVFGS